MLAVWREGLLAQKVLQNQTKGYRYHPQLKRFLSSRDPRKAIGTYLLAVYQEANGRGYHFQRDKIIRAGFQGQIPCTRGQLLYEWNHLLMKLIRRAPERYEEWKKVEEPLPHPLFHIVEGEVEDWEIRAP